ncbi:MAG TPA: chromosome segregation protein SMC, partial [Microbacterium sp.]|nr:chromosome segregation protein SMC [Microbacterium sp.]
AWVMGEQGAKTLRGGKMEDVIFAGTATRGPLGRAEVQLTIDNSDGMLPIEYAEVTISRTLFRSGASEYAINGEVCRLLDVQELLSDSGLGREMHVIVGQGRLDAVLQATPEERRGFIEEAAGILKHRRRKEKTLRKLDAMEANLTRLSDLAGEIRRQLKPLGRQAEVAREAATIAAVVRDARARLLADELVGLREALADHARSEQERHAERLVLQDRAVQTRQRIAALEHAQGSAEVDEARRVAFALEQLQERLRGLFTLANQRLALLGDADQEASPVTVTAAAVEEARAEIAELATTVEEASDAAADATRRVARARAELDALDADIAAQSALVSEHDMRLTSLRAAADAAGSTLAAVRGGVLRQQSALDAAIARRAQAQEELDGLEPDFETDMTSAEYASAYDEAQQQAADADAAVAELRDRLHATEREIDALTAQSSALGRALDVRNGATELVARGGPGVRGLVGDAVQVKAGFEPAIAAALGALAEGVLVDTRDDARAAAESARDGEVGVVDIAIAETAAPRPAFPKTPGIVAAREVVSAPEGILGVLAFVAVADDLDAALAAWPALSAAGLGGPLTLVTRSGEVLTAHTLRAGSGGGRSRLELAAERDAATDRLDEIRVVGDSLREELSDAQDRLDEARARTRTSLETLRAHDAAYAAHAEQVNRATVRHEAAAAECERLAKSLAQAEAAVADAEARAQSADAALTAAQQAPRPILDASARDEVLAALEAARDAEMRARLDVETLRERVRAGEAQAAALERRRESERAAAEQAARRAVIRRSQRNAAGTVIAQLPAVLASVDRSVASARVALASAEAERATQNAELTELRAQEAGVRDRLSTVTEGVHSLELQIHEKRLHVQSLLERVQSELGLDENILISEYGPDQPIAPDDGDDEASPTPFDRVQQKRRLQEAERKLGLLGRVNPLALEEFGALEQRHRFLTEQLADLTQTRKDLLTIIAELDERMQTIFAAAFDDTRTAFHEVFPVLFPGGAGDIALTNPDDILTTGIEVTVRPAGKKIERLSLLSGGERSLAAVALLTAIFKARPSPFYILDEVEAALDDANLGRLLGVFEQLRENSQLIVITHQKRTMEIADALYGVSMRHDGVSAVVGQRVRETVAG